MASQQPPPQDQAGKLPTTTTATATAATDATASTATTLPSATTTTTTELPSMTGGSGNGTAGASGDGEKEGEEEEPGYAPLVDPRLPTRKDTSLREFISKIDDYAPIIPEGVTNYYMTKAGLPPPPQTDPRLARLLALATQKFVADIAADAYQYSRIRASNSSAANNPMGNLGMAAGIPMPGQQAGAGGGGGAAAVGMAGAAVGGASKGGQGGAAGQQLLGIQRPGFGGGGQGGSQNRTVLTMEDLGMAVGEYGVNVKRSEFYR